MTEYMSEETKQNARVVYEKFSNGDAITDEELAMAIQFYGPLQESLLALGPVFKLASLEALRIYTALRAFDWARKENQSRG